MKKRQKRTSGMFYKLRKFVRATAVIGAVLLLATGCGNNTQDTGSTTQEPEQQSSDLQTIRLAVMTGDVTAWTAAVGKEKGIYEKYGINLEVTEFAMGINTVDAVSMNNADIGFVADFAGINRIGNTPDESGLRFFARLAKVTDYRLYGASSIQSVEDLKGKKIGLIKGTIYEYLNAVALKSVGLTVDDVELATYEANQEGISLMESGKIDAMWSGGMASPKLEAMEGVHLVTTQEELNAVSGWVYMANESYLKEHHELVGKYLQATQEVYDVMAEDLEDAGQIVEDKLAMPKEDFLALVDNYRLGIDFEQDAIDTLNAVNEWAYENHFYEKEYEVKDYIYPDIIVETYPELVADELKQN